jgi:hypothetical protein
MDFLRKIFSSSSFLNNKKHVIVISDPEYCTRYYRCSHGLDEIFECPRGTAWDEGTKSCSWVDQVNCDKKKLGYSTSTTTEGMKFLTEISSSNPLFIMFFLYANRYNNIT